MPTIGVVSDTHLPRFGRRLPRALLDGLAAASVELILHAGDHTAAFVVEALETIAPVVAVAGNNDPPDLQERFGRRHVVEVAGRPIGLTHGDLGPGRTTPERAERAFGTERVDLVVFGHSHTPLWRPAERGRPGLLNPGSPTDRRREASFSFALLRIEGSELAASIVRFTDRNA